MLTGHELGQAIRQALEKKGLEGPTAVSRKFGIKPPSVSGWFKSGAIKTETLLEIMDMCADVLGPDHWGLKHWPGSRIQRAVEAREPPPIYGEIARIKPPDDPDIDEVVRIMRATDSRGKARAVGAIKAALQDYRPAQSKRAG